MVKVVPCLTHSVVETGDVREQCVSDAEAAVTAERRRKHQSDQRLNTVFML